MKFKLEIEHGNDGMRSNYHIGLVLKNIANKLFAFSNDKLPCELSEKIIDYNGNSVGEWSFSNEPR